MTDQHLNERGQRPAGAARHRAGIAAGILGNWKIVILAWLVLLLALLPAGMELPNRLVASGEVEGGEASLVASDLEERFGQAPGRALLLVISGAPDILNRDAPALQQMASELANDPDVSGVVSYFTHRDRYLVGAGGDGVVMAVGIADQAGIRTTLRRLRTISGRWPERLTGNYPDLAIGWTGEAAVRADLVRASTLDINRAELLALPLSFLLLIWAFRSLASAAIPLVLGITTLTLASGVASMVSGIFPLSVSVQSVISLLGLALGIDYSLLMVSRFREALAQSDGGPEASREAVLVTMNRAGKTLLLSGSTVAIGFFGLALVPIDQLRSVALAGITIAVIAVALATTLVPVMLLHLGPRIDFGRLRPRASAGRSYGLWRRWGRWVTQRPLIIIAIFGLPVILLAANAKTMSIDFPAASWLPRSAQSVQAISQLQAMERSGIVYRLQVLYDLPDGRTVADSDTWSKIGDLARALADDPRIDIVLTVPGAFSPFVEPGTLEKIIPAAQLNRYVSPDRDSVRFELYPAADQSPGDVSHLVRELRAGKLGGDPITVTKLRVGGLPASAADYEDLVRNWLPDVILVVVLSSLFALAIGFRSLLAPVKAVALNLLSVLAAYGAVSLVFLDGYGVGLFGLDATVSGLFPSTPLLVFCTAYGVSMDYEVFLLSRIREERNRLGDEKSAVIEGLARTGPLITSAAAIMVVVFGAFALGQILPTQILGFALAVVVAIDALLIRVAIGPALVTIAGRFNWWPAHR